MTKKTCSSVRANAVMPCTKSKTLSGSRPSSTVERENHGMGGRIDVEPDDVADIGCEGRIVRELEGADAVRLEPVRAPGALHVGQADAYGLRHGSPAPLGRLAGRLGSVRATIRWPTSGPNGTTREGRVLSRRSPSTPLPAKRSCQRQTAVLLLPVLCMTAFVPSPSAGASTIAARQTYF